MPELSGYFHPPNTDALDDIPKYAFAIDQKEHPKEAHLADEGFFWAVTHATSIAHWLDNTHLTHGYPQLFYSNRLPYDGNRNIVTLRVGGNTSNACLPDKKV